MDETPKKKYKLLGADGKIYLSDEKGTLGGNRRNKVYERLDCSAALRALKQGDTYANYRVFIKDEETAIAAGYRPCGTCMRQQYNKWKESLSSKKE